MKKNTMKRKRKEERNRNKRKKKNKREIKKNNFLPQRTGLEICNLK
jgi:hypothetical protein